MARLSHNVIVALLVAYALTGVYAAASALWETRGTLGLTPGYGSAIRAVAPGGPADLAGIVAGDRIHLAATPFDERRYLSGVNAAVPSGTRVHFALSHGTSTRDVELAAVPYQLTAEDKSALFFECFASAIFIVVGATLIVVRPSRATWGFGLYCLIVLPTANYPFTLSSASAAFAEICFYDIVQNIGVCGLLVFALEFPRPLETPARSRVRRGIPLICSVLAAMTLYPDVANLLLGIGAQTENRVLQVAFGAAFTLALAILWDTYRRVAPDDRERMRWVLIGFGVGLLGNYVGNTLIFSSLMPFNPPVWLLNLLVSTNVLLPLTVAHAVVRHRVLDINFVVSRALVYAALTAGLALVFVLLDFVFSHVLEDFRLSIFVDAAVSIGVAFTFDALHKRMERFIEAVFFRKRRAAELRLKHLTDLLPQARTMQVVQDALVAESVDALELASAALFLPHDGGRFTRVSSLGWRAEDCAVLDDTDLLVLALRAGDRAVSLPGLPWRRADLPSGPQAPVVALRMHARADIAGIVIYGSHPAGGDIDPAELALLVELTHAAAVALDELEAERLRGETAVQASTIAELAARLDELRRRDSAAAQPAGTLAAGTALQLP